MIGILSHWDDYESEAPLNLKYNFSQENGFVELNCVQGRIY